ncbi:hypothetical protein ABBQ32_007773 [Trebouxia sp. C0010 RCD-2024]
MEDYCKPWWPWLLLSWNACLPTRRAWHGCLGIIYTRKTLLTAARLKLDRQAATSYQVDIMNHRRTGARVLSRMQPQVLQVYSQPAKHLLNLHDGCRHATNFVAVTVSTQQYKLWQ